MVKKRKEKQDDMYRRQTYLASIIESSEDAIFGKTCEGVIQSWNKGAERLYGYTAEEMIGESVFKLVPKGRVSEVAGFLERITSGEPVEHHETERVRKDGTPIFVSVTISPVRDSQGNIVGASTVARDITARKRAEDALLESKQRMELAQKAGRIGTFEWIIPTGKMIWAPELEVLYGLSPDSFKGQFENWKEAVHPDDRAGAERAFLEALQSKTDVNTTFRIIWPDHSVHWIAARSTTFYSDQGEPLRMIGINSDITEYRKLEEQFHQAQKMDAIGRLAGGVAHDFNNLLTIIIGYSQWLQQALEGNNELQNYTEEIFRAADQAAGLTRQLLAFSRQQVMEPRLVSINEVVKGMEKMLRRLIGEDINMDVACQAKIGAVRVDPGKIEQVIMNLAVNARDAMPNGGKLTIETANVMLDKNYALHHPVIRPGQHVMLAVTDTGQGMDEATKSRIFEPFFTTKEAGKGTGLGLATVYGIVKQSEGNIWVYSEVGQGTTFKVYLPCVDAPLARPEPASVQRQQRAGSETVLLVEDDQSLRTLVRQVLVICGYHVLEATRPEDAIVIAREHLEPIQLLITDVVMPNVRGPELAHTLASSHPETKTLFMSGYTDRSIGDLGLAEHDSAFLQKPFTPAVLSRTVREILDSSRTASDTGKAPG